MALVDLMFWADRLGRQNGLPIRDEGSEIHVVMHTDASDLGWGAHIRDRGVRAAGQLPETTLGGSATVREVAGVLQAAMQMKEHLRGRRVRILMDSYPAVRNLIKGGGPVEEVNVQVREWWLWCKYHAVKPLYQWVERGLNTEADELSKQAAESLTMQAGVEQRVRQWLLELGEPGLHPNHWLQTQLHVPVLGSIAARIQEMRRARKLACIVVPRWQGQAWWPQMKQLSLHVLRLGPARHVLQWDEAAQRDWSRVARDTQMEAHLLLAEGRRHSKATRSGEKAVVKPAATASARASLTSSGQL
jgi:hypothetical protein